MLRRSLGAASFAGFWRYWNPIWGYYLGRYVFRPARRVLPASLATLTTFFVSGALHDVAISLVKARIIVLCTPWFLFMGLGVILGEAAKMDLSRRPWILRASMNIAYVGSCLALTLVLRERVHLLVP
jgi:hypothetical protein